MDYLYFLQEIVRKILTESNFKYQKQLNAIRLLLTYNLHKTLPSTLMLKKPIVLCITDAVLI